MEQKLIPIYNGKREDFHWVGFGSGSGTNLAEAARVIPPSLIFTDKPAWNPIRKKGAKVAETDPERLREYNLESLVGVPRVVLNGYQLCGSAKSQPFEDYAKKSEKFNHMIVDELHRFEDEKQYRIDLIVLGGYMRLVGAPLLEAYHDRIMNVHPADLSITQKNPDSTAACRVVRTYVGDDAVYDAIRAGERYTASSVIMVNEGVDDGEILTQGPRLMVDAHVVNVPSREAYKLREAADQHQTRQKEKSDWPALRSAVELIADGRIALSENPIFQHKWRQVYLDGNPLPYEGIRLETK